MLFVVLLIQVVDKSNQPVFDVQYKEKRQQFSPDAITEMIYRKMLGRFCSGDQALLDPILLKGWQSDNRGNLMTQEIASLLEKVRLEFIVMYGTQ